MKQVLDASALLAFLHNEPGADRVRQVFGSGIVSAVNWAEIVQKSLLRGADVSGMREELSEVGVAFKPFTPEQAEIAAKLWEKTRRHGLSLADRACLALAIDQNHSVLTADHAWRKLGLGVEILLIR
ncbi:MAG: type II toxin-antitoxin system VapC family toxin [Candidatus Thiodiazotropha sp. (ex Dulcina madagascariensis)]|nr:type II toxin-antitoxin system VapC family toxin [Candidatus Thiodiazotropha sp. (ex Epidulcina cf. delphinae)]MCU7923218.1 type II toxin-antitoxin system VapC family toxin [Candidatus Thiodiazotropha sp. (ex Dulcina madagascariensis)]MCU7924906.1 type II toxin-antitoxin system VapC family toxin [Candidatus Thiodiazotropha sp. (ex Dulcina madagascariensis)]